MSVSLLATKLHFPQVRPNLVSRQRLMAILEQGLRGPLTLISAPAGSGKTTLMGEWHANAGNQFPIAWLSLDSADNDPLRFLTYLTASTKSASPNLTHPTVDLLQAPEPPTLEVITSSLIESLDAFTDVLVIVLDDYHVITNVVIHEILNNLLAHLPPTLHLAILTRADPSPRARFEIQCGRGSSVPFPDDGTVTFTRTGRLAGGAHRRLDRRSATCGIVHAGTRGRRCLRRRVYGKQPLPEEHRIINQQIVVRTKTLASGVSNIKDTCHSPEGHWDDVRELSDRRIPPLCSEDPSLRSG